MTLIIIIIIILFLVLLGWMWSSLGNMEKKTKSVCIIIGLGVMYILTFIIYQIARKGIIYENQEAGKVIRKVFVMLFTIINGYFILPYTFRKIEKIESEEIENQQLKKSIIIIVLIILALLMFEGLYLRNIIQGIMSMK